MIEYKTAQKEDFGQILNLNQKYIKRNKILWELLDSDIENHLDLPHSVIAKIDDSLAGYLLSFDDDALTINPKEIVSIFQAIISPEIRSKIRTCIGQLCVDEEFMNQGIATQMYEEFFRRNTDYDLRIADIDLSNVPSLKLHAERIEMSKIWQPKEDSEFAIFAKVLRGNPILEEEIKRLVKRVSDLRIS